MILFILLNCALICGGKSILESREVDSTNKSLVEQLKEEFFLTTNKNLLNIHFTKKTALTPEAKPNHEVQTIIDLLIVADHSMFQAFLNLTGNDHYSGKVMLEQYIKVTFEQLRHIYWRLIFLDTIRIQINLVEGLVIIREEDCPVKSGRMGVSEGSGEEGSGFEGSGEGSGQEEIKKVENNQIDAMQSVQYFNAWRQKHKNDLPKHDHAILLTKFDLLSAKGESSTQGMAYVGAMCRSDESTSVVEDIGGLSTAMIAAHEIGHSLGAHHDGIRNLTKKCDPSSNYLMSSSVSSAEDMVKFNNAFMMSECSIASIESFFKDPELSDCLIKYRKGKTRFFSEDDEQKDRSMKLGGEYFNRQQQCKIGFGANFGECTNEAYYHSDKERCKRIWCKNREQKRDGPCETKAFFPVMDGTSCDEGKFCIAGKCVINPKFLGKKCKDINKGTCTRMNPVSMRVHCRAPAFRNICCGTCAIYDKKYDGKKKAPRIISP
uniref:Peptidase M12B domain-containing protein n=1 Tax=Rhabditophanes sp. KR3021 TaxID=114890 RepID=A0AC35TV53_9BILA